MLLIQLFLKIPYFLFFLRLILRFLLFLKLLILLLNLMSFFIILLLSQFILYFLKIKHLRSFFVSCRQTSFNLISELFNLCFLAILKFWIIVLCFLHVLSCLLIPILIEFIKLLNMILFQLYQFCFIRLFELIHHRFGCQILKLFQFLFQSVCFHKLAFFLIHLHMFSQNFSIY